jgi:hypothetical protein
MVAGDFSDPTNERIIYLSAAGLIVLGLVLLLGTLVWWRRGRQEHPALAPLEVMGARAWAKAPEGDRRRRLEQVRLQGAAGSVEEPVRAAPVDLEALVRSVPQAFDDLREPNAVIAVPAVAAGESVESVPASNGDVAEVVAEEEVEAVEAEDVVAEDGVDVGVIDDEVVAEDMPDDVVAEDVVAEDVVAEDVVAEDVVADATSIETMRPVEAAVAAEPADEPDASSEQVTKSPVAPELS